MFYNYQVIAESLIECLIIANFIFIKNNFHFSPQNFNSMSQEPMNTKPGVPLPDAAAQTQNWRDFMVSITPNDPTQRVNGYHIPIADINDILSHAVSGIRAYFALPTENPNPPSPPTQSAVHLYIVPLDANGNDILTNAAGDSLIYDTTVPCPTMCGQGNILNGLPQ